MFLMCPLTLTSPSWCLLLIGHPWWLSHLVLKTVGCILSAQGPLGGYSSSSGLVLGGQGQSLCLSPCPSTLHASLEFSPASPPRKWGTLALPDWNVESGGHRDACTQWGTSVFKQGIPRVSHVRMIWAWRGMRLKSPRVKMQHKQGKGEPSFFKIVALKKAGRPSESFSEGLNVHVSHMHVSNYNSQTKKWQ